jgi:hypothetical protein
LVNFYRRMSLQEKEIIDFDDVFRDAKQKFFEVKPGLDISTAKELEFLMHKFKEMSQSSFKIGKKNVISED